MKKIVIAGAVVVGVVLLLFVGLAGYILFVTFGNADRPLAKNLTVTNEWTEINIDPPAKPVYSHQGINLRPVNFEVDRNNVKGIEIRLPDGTVVQPEVEIYDERGKRFQMHKTGFAMGGGMTMLNTGLDLRIATCLYLGIGHIPA